MADQLVVALVMAYWCASEDDGPFLPDCELLCRPPSVINYRKCKSYLPCYLRSVSVLRVVLAEVHYRPVACVSRGSSNYAEYIKHDAQPAGP